MKMQNNYILLKREDLKVDAKIAEQENPKTGTITIDISHSIRDRLNCLLQINRDSWETKPTLFQHVASFQFQIEDFEIDVRIELLDVRDDCYLNIAVDGKTKKQCVQALEDIHSRLFDKKNKMEENHVLIISYDAVSEFYCNKIFSKFAHFERLFRRLLFNIYVLNYGREYYKETMPKEIISDAKKNINSNQKKMNTSKEDRYLQEFFYALDYGALHALLFTRKWLNVDEVEKDKFISSYDNLSSVSDEELRTFILSIKPKSDWERLFQDKITIETISGDMDFVRNQRNQVAHSKTFTYLDYEKSKKTLDELIKAINEAINITENKDFLDKNLENVVNKTSEMLSKFASQMQTYFSQINFSDVLYPFAENMSRIFKAVEAGISLSNDSDNNEDEH
ncbi:MAG: hypothetical protein FWD00_00690 [Clostridiales bacterium]|nr:hypothetical protein [Clostridiales bacterium]